MKNKSLKQILFAHSAGKQDGPGEGSFDLVNTLQKELANEYHIHFPLIAQPDAPTYQMWKQLFDAELQEKTEPMILIGHSLGASTLLKYLSEEKPTITILGLFLISTPFWSKKGWDTNDFVLKEGFESELPHIPYVFLYHSKDDDMVPFNHLDFYKKAFPKAMVRALKGNDHAFENGLPVLVSDLKKLPTS